MSLTVVDYLLKNYKGYPKKYIGTHDGKFHADEVLACALLSLTEEYGKDTGFIRTRDKGKLERCDIVVDVGGKFDRENNRYDHHQVGFEETILRTKLSSAGLIYKYYGKECIAKILNWEKNDERITNAFFNKIYTDFIEVIDMVDNGDKNSDYAKKKINEDKIKLYDKIRKLNHESIEDSEKQNANFEDAVKLARNEFKTVVEKLNKDWRPTNEKLITILKTYDAKKRRYIVLEEYISFTKHLKSAEKELKIKNETGPLYFIYPDNPKEPTKWTVQATNETFGEGNRLLFPEKWRGFQGIELESISEINDVIFVHAKGFIGSSKTKEGAIEMAGKSIDLAPKKDQNSPPREKKSYAHPSPSKVNKKNLNEKSKNPNDLEVAAAKIIIAKYANKHE